jgi:hypothetical protein
MSWIPTTITSRRDAESYLGCVISLGGPEINMVVTAIKVDNYGTYYLHVVEEHHD